MSHLYYYRWCKSLMAVVLGLGAEKHMGPLDGEWEEALHTDHY